MITAKEVRRILHYEPTTGEFVWLVRRSQRVLPGTLAGFRHRGYRYIGIGRRSYAAHQLAWLYVYGRWAGRELDHINRRSDDNRISNLRLATHSQNQANAWLRSDNKSGFKGVRSHKDGKWEARINYRGRPLYLGLYETPTVASIAYAAKARELFGEFVPEEMR